MKIKDGDTVRVKKGSIVKSFNPAKPEYTLKRSQKIIIDHQLGYPDRTDVVWAGTGYYWCWTDMKNIEE